jgi:hypothetical protein
MQRPGYRVHFVRKGTTIYAVLVGGDKSIQKHAVALGHEPYLGYAAPVPVACPGNGQARTQ